MKRTVKRFDKKLNMDTATAEKIQQVNKELQKYLQSKGEVTAAKQVDYLIKNQSTVDKATVNKPNPVLDKLLETNNQILAVMRKIQADAFDEQNTSIKKVEKGSKGTTIINNYYGKNGDVKEAANDAGLDLDFGRRRKAGKNTNKKGGGKTTKTPPKAPTGNVPGTPTGNVPGEKTPTKTSTGAGKAGGKVAEKEAEAAAKAAAKAGGKGAAKGASILGKFSKFLKPIPILGTAITAATAAYAAVDGWEHASEITGVPEDNLTDTHKLAAAAGSVVSDFTFGVVGSDTVAHQALKFVQPNDVKETLKKYTDAGIIEDNTFSHDAVLDWKAIEKLPSYEIEKIIEIDDWSEEDKKKLWEANKRAALREGVKSNEQYMTQEGAVKNTTSTPQVQSTVQQPATGGQSTGGSTGGGASGGTSTGGGGGSGGAVASTGGTQAQTGSGKYASVSGAPIPNAEQSKAPILFVEDFGPGWCVVKRADGSIEKRIGNRNWRNNNPGNIEFGDFTRRFGALQGDPRFAIFPTYDMGRNAKRELIFKGKKYADLSLSQAIARYAPPTENNTANYVANVLGAVGVERFMKDYSSGEQDTILNAMQRIEGWVVGRVELIEKGSPEKGLEAMKQFNEKQAAAASSGGSSGGDSNAMNVNKNGELTGPASTKKSSSGVTTDKTSTNTSDVASGQKSASTEASTNKQASAEVNKTNRENLVQQSNNNLVNGTKQYDTQTAAATRVTSNSSSANINNQAAPRQDVGQDRILNYFS